jgi:predicted alpha/beta hydrolase family esterase
MADVFLILHGWGGNKPAHWQNHLAEKLAAEGADVRAPKMPDPTDPSPDAWMSVLHAALSDVPAGATLTVLTHSLGAINWIRHAAMSQQADFARPGVRADRVLLVAPPYVVPAIPPLDLAGAAGFFPPPLSPEGIQAVAGETTIIASDSDDYATFDQSSAYAHGLGVDIQKLSGAGHISPYYGYGEWPWVFEWAMRRAAMPPLPNT